MKYYALWHHYYFHGARSAFAISEHPETLLPLHIRNTNNPESELYNFRHNISEIKVESIECYTYNYETKMIEPYDESHITGDHHFYAFNPLDSEIFGLSFYDDIVLKLTDYDDEVIDSGDYDQWDKGEILIYLSKNCRDWWQDCSDMYQKSRGNFVMDPDIPEFLYTCWPSHLPVEADVYYEDGIMNA